MHLVAFLQNSLAVRGENLFAPQQARDDDPACNQVRDILQHGAEEIPVVYREAARFDFLGVCGDVGCIVLRGLRWVLPEENAHEEHYENDADDTEGICNSVPDTRKGGVNPGRGKGGICGPEGGRVRDGATEHPDEHGYVVMHIGEKVQAKCHDDAEQHDARGKDVQHQAVPAYGIHETGAHLHADGIYEKDEAEFLDEVEYVGGYAEAQVPEDDAYEKRSRPAEADSLDLDLAEHEADCRRERDCDHLLPDRGLSEQVDKPFHISPLFAAKCSLCN